MVEEATEFETANELFEAIETNMRAYKVHNQRSVFQDKVMQYVVNEVDFDLPEALVSAEVEARIRNLMARLKESEIGIEDYLKITGQEEASFLATTRSEADHSLSARVILESIAAIEAWEVEEDEMVERIVQLLEIDRDEAVSVLDGWNADGQVEALTSDILRERALTSLVDAATAVDSDGNPVDLTPVVIETEEDKEQEEDKEEESASEEVAEDSEASETHEDATDEPEEQG
jgi:trigger factor